MRWAFDDSVAMLHRIRAEFREMPGLKLTIVQASRLWHLDHRSSKEFLDALVVDGLLRRTSEGAYLVAVEPASSRLPHC
jgi:hypothetical protein